MDSLVRVTDEERTVIDCIDRIDRAGGLEELLHAIAAMTYLNENKLLNYLEIYDKQFLYQKTVFAFLFSKRIKIERRIRKGLPKKDRKKYALSAR
jgi:predicted transcriptional regulator of viral defense system